MKMGASADKELVNNDEPFSLTASKSAMRGTFGPSTTDSSTVPNIDFFIALITGHGVTSFSSEDLDIIGRLSSSPSPKPVISVLF